MNFQEKILKGESFEFGKNWQRFLSVLNDQRIIEAEESICDFLGEKELKGKTFLDIGSGSGLFSLAARRLEASVHSFDYDIDSVECTKELKRRYFRDDPHWHIEQASILDRHYIESLGQFDICYAWGVLHHTGSLWRALYNAHLPVAEGGFLFIGIYNDQGIISAIWELAKRTYCSGRFAKILLTAIFYPIFFLSGLLIDIAQLKNPVKRYKEHTKYRGMSLVHDWKDWLGGFPYEPAKPGRVISFYENLDYELRNFRPTRHGFGNNEFLFQKKTKEARQGVAPGRHSAALHSGW
jgi:2-polyprenyl-3-methyl-5-hydroxy-6-metoxy-1,4-benzoquinol methylase